MERIAYGTVTLDVQIMIDCMRDDLEHEIIEQTNEMFENMGPEILLRKLLNDSNVKINAVDVEFYEVD